MGTESDPAVSSGPSMSYIRNFEFRSSADCLPIFWIINLMPGGTPFAANLSISV